MRSAVWILSIALGMPPASAGDSPYCRLFGFDASPMLGADAAMCGRILDADERREAESGTLEERRRATSCALEAQAQGRAFVYTYRLLVAPDIDMVHQAVFGAHGERLLLRMGVYQGENIRSVEACESLRVREDGQVSKQGCRLRQGLAD
jgi:hypothetical protein